MAQPAVNGQRTTAFSWRRVFLLLGKDLRRRRRSPLGVLVMLAFPLVFSGMLALAFGGDGDDGGLPRVRLLYEDRDDGLVGGFVASFLNNENVTDLVDLVPVGEEGQAMMEAGEASALLRVPEGATDALLAGEPVAFELIRNPAQGILPEIAEQMSAILAEVMGILVRLLEQQLDATGLQLEDVRTLDDLADFDFDHLDGEDLATIFETVRRTGKVVYRYFDETPMTLTVVDLGDEEQGAVGSDTAEDGGENDDGTSRTALVFLFVMPGIAVYSLFMIGDQMMRDLLTEKNAGTLRRQLTAPLTVPEVITAKVLLAMVVALGALVVLAVVALVVAERGIDLLGFALLAAALVLAVTGAAATIYGSVSNERQGSTLASLVYLVLAFGSGSFIPLNSLPPVMSRVAPFSPFYWGTEGFKSLLNGGQLADVVSMATWLMLLGLVLLALGSWRLHRQLLRGEAP